MWLRGRLTAAGHLRRLRARHHLRARWRVHRHHVQRRVRLRRGACCSALDGRRRLAIAGNLVRARNLAAGPAVELNAGVTLRSRPHRPHAAIAIRDEYVALARSKRLVGVGHCSAQLLEPWIGVHEQSCGQRINTANTRRCARIRLGRAGLTHRLAARLPTIRHLDGCRETVNHLLLLELSRRQLAAVGLHHRALGRERHFNGLVLVAGDGRRLR